MTQSSMLQALDCRLAADSFKDRALGWWLGLVILGGTVVLLLAPVKYQAMTGIQNEGDKVLSVGYEARWGEASDDLAFVHKGDSLARELMGAQRSAAVSTAETVRHKQSFWPLVGGAFLLGRYARRGSRVRSEVELGSAQA